jgi:ATP-binding cassette, subfamily B, bacterial
VLGLIGTAALYGAYAWIALAAVIGRITLGQMTMYLMLFRQGQSAVAAILSAIGGMYEDNLYLSTLYEYLETPVPQRRRARRCADRTRPTASASKRQLHLPRQPSRPALQRHRPAHPARRIAGAGRRERLRQDHPDQAADPAVRPDQGRILLDGRDLREWDESRLRQRIGVIFQDFARYQFMVGENIGVGDVRISRTGALAGGGAEWAWPTPFIAAIAGRLRYAARQVVQGRPGAVRRPVAEDRAGRAFMRSRSRHPGAGRTDRGHGRGGRGDDLRALPRADHQPHRHPDLAPLLHRAHGRARSW